MCAPGGERDMQDTSPEGALLGARYARMSVKSLETQNPTHTGGTPSGRAVAMGCPS
jgi:hypothetical protein